MTSSPLAKRWFCFKDFTCAAKEGVGNTAASTNTFCSSSNIGNFSSKYVSVRIVAVVPKNNSHFSLMVKIPMRSSQTGRV